VWLVHKLRDEAHFPTVDAMVAQIHDDAKQARLLLQQG
jgi:FAD synthase